MKNSTYYCRLSGGNIHRVEFATSAGEAIYQAIWLHRGNTVIECWQGPELQDPRYAHGKITYEVPAHDAVPHDAVKPKLARKKDHSGVMAFMEDVK